MDQVYDNALAQVHDSALRGQLPDLSQPLEGAKEAAVTTLSVIGTETLKAPLLAAGRGAIAAGRSAIFGSSEAAAAEPRPRLKQPRRCFQPVYVQRGRRGCCGRPRGGHCRGGRCWCC